MVQAMIELPNIDDLSCDKCPCRDGESNFCNLEYCINESYKKVSPIYNSRPRNCQIKYISKEDIFIPYLMHKEMGIPLLECQKAYDVAIEYLRNKSKLKG